jgi:hypothetical protein
MTIDFFSIAAVSKSKAATGRRTPNRGYSGRHRWCKRFMSLAQSIARTCDDDLHVAIIEHTARPEIAPGALSFTAILPTP